MVNTLDQRITTYERHRLEESRGRDGKTNFIGNNFALIRPPGTPSGLESVFGLLAFWLAGKIKDKQEIKRVIEAFKNESGQQKMMIGMSQTSKNMVSFSITLTHIDPWMENFAQDSDQALTEIYTRYAGDRKQVTVLADALATGHTFAETFTTTNYNLALAPVSSPTAVSQAYSGSYAATAVLIEDAFEANAGVLSASWNTTTHTLTVLTKPGYTIQVTSAAATSGSGAPAVSSSTLTDTSIKETTVDASATDPTGLTVVVDDASVFSDFIDKQVVLPTGDPVQGVRNEYPWLKAVDTTTNTLYWYEATQQLPEDGVSVKLLAGYRLAINKGKKHPPCLWQIKYYDDLLERTRTFVIYKCQIDSVDIKPTNDGDEYTFNMVAMHEYIDSEWKSHDIDIDNNIGPL